MKSRHNGTVGDMVKLIIHVGLVIIVVDFVLGGFISFMGGNGPPSLVWGIVEFLK